MWGTRAIGYRLPIVVHVVQLLALAVVPLGDTMGKWILGVLASIITGVVVYWLTVGMDNPQHPPNLTIATPIASAFKLNFFYRESAGGPSKPILPGSVLHSGDHYKIVFTPHRNGYVYLFQVDSHGQFFSYFR